MDYSKKNKGLLIGAVVLFLLCWWLSFSKTIGQYQQYRKLHKAYQSQQGGPANAAYLEGKSILLDSLLSHYRVDSAQWENNFLQNVSLSLRHADVSVSYEGKGSHTDQLLEKELTLQGTYIDLVEAIDWLERDFFVKRVGWQDGRCTVVLVGARE